MPFYSCFRENTAGTVQPVAPGELAHDPVVKLASYEAHVVVRDSGDAEWLHDLGFGIILGWGEPVKKQHGLVLLGLLKLFVPVSFPAVSDDDYEEEEKEG
jgi:hypothetical protein